MAIKPIPNESELIKQVISGSERAFSKLFDGYYKALGDYVYRLTESLEITEEIVQDVFIKIWTKKEALSGIESFSNYLFIISRNQTYNFLRKKANEKVRQLEWEKDFEENSILNDDDKSGEFYRSLLEKAIEKLPPQQKKVYLLSRNERLKYEEIAQKLNISPETVKKHMKSAIKFLKSNVNVENDGVLVLILLAQLIFK
jgi:RNA polymerase sigma-70 factor (ECF subfamily)